MTNKIHAGMTRLSLCVAMTFALAACGGGSSSVIPASSTNPQPAQQAATQLTGTVAVGNALAGASVTLTDSKGNTVATTSGTNGSYSLSLTGLTAPFLIVANDPSGVNAPMYSVMASIPVSTSTTATANVTPLTTAVAAELTSDGNPIDLTNTATLAAVTQTAITTAVTTLNTVLAPVLTANGVSGSTFNPMSTAFTPNQTGADAVIDSITVTPAPTGGLQLANISTPNLAISLNSSTSTGTTIAQPPVAAGYLSTLLQQLSSCLSGTASACSSAIDTNYLENGYGSANEGSATAAFEAFHASLGASGSTITGVNTLMYWPAGQGPFPNITNPVALVRIFYTNSAGVSQFALTVVQQTQAATTSNPAVWDIIGNQSAYDVKISSFVAQRQFLDSTDANNSRYESGLSISITQGSGSVNPSTVNAVKVTGPGLPVSGVWLEPRSGTGNDLLALTSRAITSAPTTAANSSSNTSLYRWSWQALPSNTGAFAFAVGTGDAGYYASTALTASTLPAAFPTYTATLYNAAGTSIGTATVVNSTPLVLPAAAANIAWQTLGTNSTSFLNPSGSTAASTGTIDWSNTSTRQGSAPVVTGVQIQAGSDTSSSAPAEVDGWWEMPTPWPSHLPNPVTVTAGVAQNGTQTCTTACQFPALTTGVSRLVQLTWSADGVSYFNIFKYNY